MQELPLLLLVLRAAAHAAGSLDATLLRCWVFVLRELVSSCAGAEQASCFVLVRRITAGLCSCRGAGLLNACGSCYLRGCND